MGDPATNLDEVRDENLPFSSSPVTDWWNAHVEELHAKYSGQHVAIDPAVGVIASGSYDEVSDELDALGIPIEADVVIAWVP